MLAATHTLLAPLDPLPYRGRMDRLAEWARTAPDRAGRPVLAVRVAERVGARLRDLRAWLDPAALAGAIARLAGSGDLDGGLFAAALVRHGAGYGWKAPWRDLLLRLRQHPNIDVREEAYAIDMS